MSTLGKNHPGTLIYQADAIDFLHKMAIDSAFRSMIGNIDHVHLSPPCQGFSGTNRTGGKNDAANNELSMTILKIVRLSKPVTVS